MTVSTELIEGLKNISTATLSTVLFKKGVKNIWIRSALPIKTGQPRSAGIAFTMRFIPQREDLANPSAWSSPRSSRVAVEQVPEHAFVVVDAMGVQDAGVFGDILCARLQAKGAAGLVTDGVVRDINGVVDTSLPVWCQGTAAPAAVAQMLFVDWEQPVACGGTAIFPGDIIVADDDGALVIPKDMILTVIEEANDQEQLEAWILQRVKDGAELTGLYPPNEENLQAYRKSRGTL